MSAVMREGDLSVGHDGWPPRPSIQRSSNVFINGIPCVRVTDSYDIHCKIRECHGGKASGGSSTVFVNGLAIHRTGDAIDCGDTAGTGSPNVFAG